MERQGAGDEQTQMLIRFLNCCKRTQMQSVLIRISSDDAALRLN